MTDYQDEALQHELTTTLTLLDDSWKQIEIAHDNFFDDASLKNGFDMVRVLRTWINYRQQYDLLHKIYHHGYGQEDTKGE